MRIVDILTAQQTSIIRNSGFGLPHLLTSGTSSSLCWTVSLLAHKLVQEKSLRPCGKMSHHFVSHGQSPHTMLAHQLEVNQYCSPMLHRRLPATDARGGSKDTQCLV